MFEIEGSLFKNMKKIGSLRTSSTRYPYYLLLQYERLSGKNLFFSKHEKRVILKILEIICNYLRDHFLVLSATVIMRYIVALCVSTLVFLVRLCLKSDYLSRATIFNNINFLIAKENGVYLLKLIFICLVWNIWTLRTEGPEQEQGKLK